MKKQRDTMTLEQYRATETHDSLMNKIINMAKSMGYDKIYHTWRSYHSPKGFFDIVIGRSRDGRLLFIEVKKEGDELTPDQQKWFEFLTLVASLNETVEVYVWYPHDWDEIAKILQEVKSESA